MSIISMSTMSAARWKLILQAQSWRYMMAIGMRFHKMADPRPREPSFKKRISTTVSPQKGEIELLFYTPSDYDQQLAGGFQRPRHNSLGRSLSLKRRGRSKSLSSAQLQLTPNEAVSKKLGFPVVVNFHGGGFTIGSAGDDARWADAVCRYVNAVVVSVEYRLAPEHPFPTAVEDGADAILYLTANAVELGIDPTRIAVSGFSAGGNMAFTVPLKLQDVLNNPYSSRYPEQQERDAPSTEALQNSTFNPIVAIVAWYPSTDFATNTRPERRLSNLRPDKELPAFFTAMFDASYLPSKSDVSLSSPYLSPGLASEPMLRALPDHIIMYTCEWDELLVEAERMRDRLTNEAGKQVVYHKMEGRAHAFDKSPNPLKWDPAIEAVYEEACESLKKAFNVDDKRTHSGHF